MRACALIAVALCATFYAAAADDAVVFCVGESTKVKADDPPQTRNLTWDAATRTVTIGSARNEYVAFQIAVHADKDALTDVTVVPGELKGPNNATIPLSQIDLFVEHYLNVKVTSRGDINNIVEDTTTGMHPTQMVPFSARKFGAPYPVPANTNQPVWVDIYVPENATPGSYSGIFKVKTGDKELASINVALTVWNFTLPQETHFKTLTYTGPENLVWAHRTSQDLNDPKFIALEDRYFQMAHQHRLNFAPSAGGIVDEIGRRYRKYYDGSGFTERVGKGVGQNILCMAVEGSNEKELKQSARDILEFYEKAKFTAPLITYIWDEPHSDEDFAQSKQRCKWVHEATNGKIQTYISTPGYQHYDAGDVNNYSETAIPDIPKVLERGDAVWSVNGGYCAGPYTDAPGYGGRSIAWMGWKMHLPGWQFWDTCYWLDKQNMCHKEKGRWVRDFTYADAYKDPGKYLVDLWNDPLNFDEARKKGYKQDEAIRLNGDGLLFYPGYDVGIDGPIAPYSLKSLRRGLQDYEYLWLLKQAGQDAAIKPIVDSVCPEPGKWTKNPEAWDKARLDLAKLLNK